MKRNRHVELSVVLGKAEHFQARASLIIQEPDSRVERSRKSAVSGRRAHKMYLGKDNTFSEIPKT